MNNRTYATSSKSSYTKNLFFLLLFTPIAIQCMEGMEGVQAPASNDRQESPSDHISLKESLQKYRRIRKRRYCIGGFCSLGVYACCSMTVLQIPTSIFLMSDDPSAAYSIALLATSPLWLYLTCVGMKLACSTVENERKQILKDENEQKRLLTEISKLPLLPQIRKQNVHNALILLEYRQLLYPNATLNDFDERGYTPLLEAIRYYDPAKDPKARIIKLLIANGASLWYENPNAEDDGSVSPGKLEEGTRTIPPHQQPMLMLANRKDLYEAVLMPLCAMAQEKLTAKRKKPLSHDEKVVQMLLMDTKKESGKDEE